MNMMIWWNKYIVANDIKNEVKKRKNAETKNRYLAKRGNHEIFYTDI